jgi:O-antigen/teichoic acid export membrane protein
MMGARGTIASREATAEQPEAVAPEPTPRLRPMLVKASATAFLQGFSLLAGFLTTLLLARLLGAVGYGHYAYALAWAGFLTTPAILGLDRYLVRSVAVYAADERWGLVKGLLKRTNQLVLLAGTAIATVGVACAVLLMSGPMRVTFCIGMALVPVTALTFLRQGAMQAFHRVVTGQLPEYLIRPLLVLVGVVALNAAGVLSSASAMAANVLAVSVAFLAGATMLLKALPPTLRTAVARYRTRAWLRASLPMMWFAALWFGNNYLATLVVGAISGSSAAGIYSVVEKGAQLIVLVLFAVNMPLAPAIARLYARGEREQLQHLTERVARATFLASLPIALFFALWPEAYLKLFGSSFTTGATALTILAVAQAVNAAAGPSGNVLIMTGHERRAASGIAIGLLANIGLGVLLVPTLGVTGGAIASGSSLVLWNAILVRSARRELGVNVSAMPWLSVRAQDAPVLRPSEPVD